MTIRMVATIGRYIGLSTDLKPADDTAGERVWDGSSFFETDTGKFFFYSASDGWVARDPNIISRGGLLTATSYDQSLAMKLDDVLIELKKMTLHLSSLSGESFAGGDIEE